MKRGETVAEAAVREFREETGLQVEITGIVGVFSTPDHVIAYLKGRQGSRKSASPSTSASTPGRSAAS